MLHTRVSCMLMPPTERNTTWHHPEADTSPNASLCSDDITQEMIYQRQQRRSFFKKTRRTLSHGKVAAEPQFQGLAVVLAGPQPPRSRDGSEGGESEARVSKDSADSADSIQSNEPPSPTTSSHQKRNVLRKMWHSSSK